MVAAVSSFTASSLTPVSSNQTITSSPQQILQEAPLAREIASNQRPLSKDKVERQSESTPKEVVSQEEETRVEVKQAELPEPPSIVALSDTFRVLGSAPDFQVHSTGSSVYLTHNSGYIISLATGQERTKVQFNDSNSKVDAIIKSEPNALLNPAANINNSYTRTGGLDQLSIPTGLLQNIQA